MSDKLIANKKGVSLIIVIIIATIIIFIVTSVMPQALNQRQLAEREADSIRAFYGAESGINRALRDLNNNDWSGWNLGEVRSLSLQLLDSSEGDTIAYYEVELDMTDPDEPLAEATGYSPTTSDAEKSIRSRFRKREAAIIATGGIEITGTPKVAGEIVDNTDFTFKGMFGQTPEEVKWAETTEVVIDPGNNYSPVPAPGKTVTWFELVNKTKAMITATGWTGSGILIVEGGDLEITGGTFKGILWVKGNLNLAIGGNPQLMGAIFVEGDAVIDGTPTMSYFEEEVINAFGYNPMPFGKISWREIYK